jgi:hypothetical protein
MSAKHENEKGSTTAISMGPPRWREDQQAVALLQPSGDATFDQDLTAEQARLQLLAANHMRAAHAMLGPHWHRLAQLCSACMSALHVAHAITVL